MGQIISKEGIKADPQHIKAIKEFKTSNCKADIRLLLGMLNYLSEFIPNLSKLSAPLRSLLKIDLEFVWDIEQEEHFEKLKSLLSTTPVIKDFNSNKEIVTQCDVSKDGLGSCLIQEGHPASFVSSSLTETKQNYAQIDKKFWPLYFHLKDFTTSYMAEM
ncbi:Retrovirus-related Pol polyprotein from transposon 17.6 [Araneus ventricosus]|uniref:Retrovirus-related Pol polyprotein from transposon 17.6 n=1 Tax=Araneus ventricosus TaxID=182803 RepID=A0A4Y2UEJ5_ARAVE|nr:Retrovirus-related Pol polyprotein from transposon 17.6 [Araneus ventricosus]